MILRSFQVVVLAVIYLACLDYGHSFALPNEGRLYSPEMGLLLALLLSIRLRFWLPTLLSALLLEEFAHAFLFHDEFRSWEQLSLVLSNESGVALSALMLRAWVRPQRSWTSFGNLLRLSVACLLCGAVISATLGTFHVVGISEGPSFLLYWRNRWLADALAMLTIGPVLLWSREAWSEKPEYVTWETIVSMVVCLGLTAYLFCQPRGIPQPFFLYPPFIWLATRVRPHFTAWTILISTIVALICTQEGLGPFIRFAPESDIATSLQMFLVTLGLSSLSISSNLFDRESSRKRRTQITSELEESDSRYEALFELASVPILVVGSTRIERTNEAARMLLKRNEDELNVPLETLAAPEQTAANRFVELWPHQIRDGMVMPWTVLDGEGKALEVELYFSLLEMPSGSKIQLVMRDKTRLLGLQSMLEEERRNLEQQVAQATADLEVANKDLAQTTLNRQRFLGTITHELRTPLSAVVGRCETLKEGLWGAITSEQEGALQRISDSSKFLNELISDILAMAKSGHSESGETSTTSIQEICDSSLDLVANLANNQQVKLLANDYPDTKIVLDKRVCKQILVNLLTNAIKFTPPEGSVELKAQLAEACVEFSVVDTGLGIPEDLKPTLFEPFSRADQNVPGFGLGLSLVKGLVDELEGRIVYQSESGSGTSFFVTIPLESEAQETKVSHYSSLHPQILVAAGQDDSLGPLYQHLRKSEYRVTLAEDELALKRLFIQKTPKLLYLCYQANTLECLVHLGRLRGSKSLVKPSVIVLSKETLTEAQQNELFAVGVTLILPHDTPLIELESLGLVLASR